VNFKGRQQIIGLGSARVRENTLVGQPHGEIFSIRSGVGPDVLVAKSENSTRIIIDTDSRCIFLDGYKENEDMASITMQAYITLLLR
jgi:hypothetical protein